MPTTPKCRICHDRPTIPQMPNCAACDIAEIDPAHPLRPCWRYSPANGMYCPASPLVEVAATNSRLCDPKRAHVPCYRELIAPVPTSSQAVHAKCRFVEAARPIGYPDRRCDRQSIRQNLKIWPHFFARCFFLNFWQICPRIFYARARHIANK